MTKGYLLFAVDGADSIYSTLAKACAQSIKNTQPAGSNSVSVVTDHPDRFDQSLFDHIIEYSGPGGMDVRSRAYDYTPYDHTVCLDSDMLFLRPVDHYWDIFQPYNIFLSHSPQTYRGAQFSYGPYRKIYKPNQLPDVYSAWTYFNRSTQAKEFFELVKHITDNPRLYIQTFLPDYAADSMPTDEAMALALCILDITLPAWDFPRITHMKPAVQGWRDPAHDWLNCIRFNLDSQGQVKLGVWQQAELLHYVKKDIITPTIVQTLENVQ